jgi:hypothetical protein
LSAVGAGKGRIPSWWFHFLSLVQPGRVSLSRPPSHYLISPISNPRPIRIAIHALPRRLHRSAAVLVAATATSAARRTHRPALSQPWDRPRVWICARWPANPILSHTRHPLTHAESRPSTPSCYLAGGTLSEPPELPTWPIRACPVPLSRIASRPSYCYRAWCDGENSAGAIRPAYRRLTTIRIRSTALPWARLDDGQTRPATWLSLPAFTASCHWLQGREKQQKESWTRPVVLHRSPPLGPSNICAHSLTIIPSRPSSWDRRIETWARRDQRMLERSRPVAPSFSSSISGVGTQVAGRLIRLPVREKQTPCA